MVRIAALVAFCSLALSLCAADFQNGQAARAVIGQPSFSARESGITARALSISNGHLYVADVSNHLLAFDLAQIPGAAQDLAGRKGTGCTVCGFSPVSIFNQSVISGISAVSVAGKAVAVADPTNHRVLVWHDTSSDTAIKGPDVILGGDGSSLVEPISVALDGQRLFVGDGALHRVLVWNSLPRANNQPADVVLGQQTIATSGVPEVPGADTIGRPVALESDGTNLFVADAVYRRVMVFTAADVPLHSNALVNSASLGPSPLAPGELVTITGLSGLPEAAADGADQPLPNKLAGVEVMLDGLALPLLSVSATEIHAQLPYDIGNRTSASLYVRSELEGQTFTSTAVALTLTSVDPGLFAFPGTEPRPGMAIKEGVPVTSSSPAKPNQEITLWAAGLGLLNTPADSEAGIVAGVPNAFPNAPVLASLNATVNGVPAEVVSAVLPQGSIGIYEVRVVLPANLPRSGSTTLTISQEGRQSNSVTIPVQTSIQ